MKRLRKSFNKRINLIKQQMEVKMDSLKEYVVDFLDEKLDLYEDREVYGADLAYILCEEINCNGSVTFSNQLARDYLNDWEDDSGAVSDYYEYYKDNFGENCPYNGFSDAEALMVSIIIQKSIDYLNQCEFINKNWDDNFVLTKENIAKIKKELKEI